MRKKKKFEMCNQSKITPAMLKHGINVALYVYILYWSMTYNKHLYDSFVRLKVRRKKIHSEEDENTPRHRNGREKKKITATYKILSFMSPTQNVMHFEVYCNIINSKVTFKKITTKTTAFTSEPFVCAISTGLGLPLFTNTL